MPTFATLFGNILGFINGVLVPFIFAIAFIVFIWGIFQYFIAGGADEEKRKQGRSLAMWGIIGFAIMITVWGLVAILVNTLGMSGVTSQPGVRLPTSTGAPRQQQGGNNFFGGAGGGGGNAGLPAGAVCSSRQDSECSTGECDWDAVTRDARGEPVFTCVPQRSN